MKQKFRKKPIVIEAEQWLGMESLGKIEGVYCAVDCDRELADWRVMHKMKPGQESGRYYIDTLEGFHEVSKGDWVITGIAGERYPCKDSIFEATYEKADDKLEDCECEPQNKAFTTWWGPCEDGKNHQVYCPVAKRAGYPPDVKPGRLPEHES